MSTQQDIYAAGSENRPPMLNKENYVPWSSRLLRYAKSRPNGKLIYNSIMNGPYVRRMIPEPGDTDREVPVPATFHEQTDDELTFETAQKSVTCATNMKVLILEFKKRRLIVNEWEREESAVTIVHQTKDLHTTDYTQLYDFLKYNQKEVDDQRAERLAKTHDPLALMANSNNPFNYPVFHQDQPSPSTYMQQPQPINNNYNPQPSFNQNYMQQPMPKIPKTITNPTTAMNMALMVGGNGGNQFRQYAGQNVGYQNGYNAVQNVGNQVVQDAVQNQGVQNIGNQNGQIGVQNIGNGNVVAARAEGNAPGNNGNQISLQRRGMGHLARNCTLQQILMKFEEGQLQTAFLMLICSKHRHRIFNMFTQEEQYTELLEPIPEPHQEQQNDSNVISDFSCVEQEGGTVDQHPATVEETRAYFESLYNNLALEVEKVNSVNRKLNETNADLTTELARYKNQEKCFEISQEKYDKLERCYQKSVYQEQCLTKKINALHLSSGKQITTLHEEISNLSKQLSTEKSTVSFLLEEKKKLKSDFKIREDELLDKQIHLENKIKELDNILVKTGQSIQTMHMLSPKPDSFYHTEQKMALGYQNPFYLKQAQRKQQSLYNGKVLLEKHDPPVVHDSEETLQLAQESRQKMKQLNKEIKPANYTKIKASFGDFCFSNGQDTEECSCVARKFLNEVKSTIVTLQRVVKHRMTLDTHNWSSSAHQEIHKILKEENFPIINQVDSRLQNFEIQFLKEAAKFVRDFKSLAKEADESLAKHKALELEIERLLRAYCQKLENENVELEFQVRNYEKEIAHLKTTYKNLFDSISVSRAQTKTIIDSLQHKLHDTIYENAKLRAQLFDKVSDQKDTNKGMSANTKFAKQSILGKPPSSSRPKPYAVPTLPNSTAFPKVGETNALSNPVTSNSVPSSRESTVVNNERVIAPGIFRINPVKANRVANFVPNKHVKTSVRTKPITVSQPHDDCVRQYVNGMKSRKKNQSANVSKSANQKKHKAQVWKPKNIGSKERFASPKPSKPRSCLRWSPTGRFFDLQGKIIASSKSESQSDCSKGDNACTSNPQEPINKRLQPVLQRQRECTLQCALLKKKRNLLVFTSVDMIVMTSMIELESLFGPLFGEYLNGENQVVSKSSIVPTADASDKCQQQQDSTSSTSTLATTITADGNFDL
ncbi:hypothetical protein Tco_1401685 [Tanacetum coccineum]